MTCTHCSIISRCFRIPEFDKDKPDYLERTLLHQLFSDAYGAYHALEKLYNKGKVRAINNYA